MREGRSKKWKREGGREEKERRQMGSLKKTFRCEKKLRYQPG